MTLEEDTMRFRSTTGLAGAVLGALLFASCFPAYYWRLDVRWAIEGSTENGLCATYGIAVWDVSATRPGGGASHSFACGTWDSGTFFHHLEEGEYEVAVTAVDDKGTKLRTRIVSVRVLDDGRGLPALADVQFMANDFRAAPPVGKASLDVYWNINGTVDGTDTGKSWDTCDEVGAVKAQITVDGDTTTHDCAADGNMAVTLTVEEGSGDHKVEVALLDQQGGAITSTADALVKATNSAPGTFIADFYYYSFVAAVRKQVTGVYRFTTSFEPEKRSCDETSPGVDFTTLALAQPADKGGLPVDSAFAGPDDQWVKTDGKDRAACFGVDEVQRLRALPWGLYQATLQAGTGSGSAALVCWEGDAFQDFLQDPANTKYADEILVGAGPRNPVRELNLKRTESTGACR